MYNYSILCSLAFNMEKELTQHFVERKIHPLTILPLDWGVESKGSYYELDLKMCQLRKMIYSFQWGDERFVFNKCLAWV